MSTPERTTSAHAAELRRAQRRYDLLGRCYQLVSFERWFYADARSAAVDALRLRPGMTVIDIGCGTGLNLERLVARVGSSGRVIGIDLSERMLARARARVRRHGCRNVTFVRSDAAELTGDLLRDAGAPDDGVDAALATLALQAMPGWRATLAAMVEQVRSGGRIATMDHDPDARTTGPSALLRRAFWRAGCELAAMDCGRQPWDELREHAHGVTVRRYTAGHVVVAAGTVAHESQSR